MPSEAVSARSAGTTAEKTNEVLLMHWWSTTICDLVQNLPDEFKLLVTDPMSMSICMARVTCGQSNQHTKRRRCVWGHHIDL